MRKAMRSTSRWHAYCIMQAGLAVGLTEDKVTCRESFDV